MFPSLRPQFLAIALLLASAPACVSGPPVPSPLEASEVKPEDRQASPVRLEARGSFAATGDILMHGAVKQSAAAAAQTDEAGLSLNHEGFGTLFDGIAPVLSSVDYAFANLETPVAPDADRGSRAFVFNVSEALLPALDDAGIDIVSFANNHVYDQGIRGLKETVARLSDSPLDFIGAGTDCAAARGAHIEDVGGLQVGFIASTMLFNSNLNQGESAPCAFAFDMAQAKAAIAATRKAGAELVVFSIHWGAEYKVTPTTWQQNIGRDLLEAGVDLVLGHHAHVLLPIEVHETSDGRMGVIAYGLGNNISNQSRKYIHGVHSTDYGDPRDGVILLVDFVRKDYGTSPSGEAVQRAELANLRAVPTWTSNDWVGRKTGQKPVIRIHPTQLLLDQARAALATAKDDATSLALKKEVKLYEDRIERVREVLGEGFVTTDIPGVETLE